MRGRWTPVVAFAATTTAGYGVLFYSYGVLLGPMQQDLRWSRTFLSGAFSAALVVGSLATIPIGRWLDRHPPRALFLAGGLLAAAGVAAWSVAATPLMFALVWVVLGVGQAVLFYNPAFTVLTKRFAGAARHRAFTSVTLVAGLASTIFAPLTAVLQRALGWRETVLVLAVLLAAVTLPAFWFGLRGQPRGGDRPGAAEPAPASALPREVLRTGPFWLFTLAYLLSAGTTIAVAVHLVPFLRLRGFGTEPAAAALGAVGLVQVLGRGLYVRLSARLSALRLGTLALGGKAAGLLLLLLLPGIWGVGVFVLVYGSANGAATLTQATSLGELYGAEHFGAISGVVGSVGALGAALAPLGAAAAIDLLGQEPPVFAGLVALAAAAAGLNQVVARRPGSVARRPES